MMILQISKRICRVVKNWTPDRRPQATAPNYPQPPAPPPCRLAQQHHDDCVIKRKSLQKLEKARFKSEWKNKHTREEREEKKTAVVAAFQETFDSQHTRAVACACSDDTRTHRQQTMALHLMGIHRCFALDACMSSFGLVQESSMITCHA